MKEQVPVDFTAESWFDRINLQIFDGERRICELTAGRDHLSDSPESRNNQGSRC